MENGALDEPWGMLTDEGTAATPGLELTRETVTPPDGAGPFSETVPFTLVPPWINAGALMPASDGGVTVIGLVNVTVLPVADMLLTVLAVTGVVVMLKEADVAPEGTVIEEGVEAALGTELPRETFRAAVAMAFRVTRFAEAVLPPTAEACTVRKERSTGFNVSVAFAVSAA
jgi:hypothetical protein